MEFIRFDDYGAGPVSVFTQSNGAELVFNAASLRIRIENLKARGVGVDVEMSALAQMTFDATNDG